METLFEILKVILPVIITGLFTFRVTKYTYNKNVPLDKMEISYNRIYYPLKRIISDENINNDIDIVINKSKIYFEKYDKYVDNSTKDLFKSLCKCDRKAKRKHIYVDFRRNVYNECCYLRRRLGYLEPNFFQWYKYSSSADQLFFAIMIQLLVMFALYVVSDVGLTFFDNDINKIPGIFFFFAYLFIALAVLIICELLVAFFTYLSDIIRK